MKWSKEDVLEMYDEYSKYVMSALVPLSFDDWVTEFYDVNDDPENSMHEGLQLAKDAGMSQADWDRQNKKKPTSEEPNQNELWDQVGQKLVDTYFGPPEYSEMMTWLMTNFTITRK